MALNLLKVSKADYKYKFPLLELICQLALEYGIVVCNAHIDILL